MKKHSILTIILLFILSLVGLTACGQSNQPTNPSITNEGTSSESANTVVCTETTSPEITEPTYYVTGEWYCTRKDDSLVLILNDDMSFNVLYVDNSDSSLISKDNGTYTLSGTKITLNFDTSTQWECDYDSVNLCITVDEYTFMYYSKTSTHYYSIAGTWAVLSSGSYFPFHFGEMSYGHASSITYYNDNTYSISFDNYDEYGRYSVIHDGTAVEMDDAGYHFGEVMKFQLPSNDILLIEADPSWDSGIYYVLIRIS